MKTLFFFKLFLPFQNRKKEKNIRSSWKSHLHYLQPQQIPWHYCAPSPTSDVFTMNSREICWCFPTSRALPSAPACTHHLPLPRLPIYYGGRNVISWSEICDVGCALRLKNRRGKLHRNHLFLPECPSSHLEAFSALLPQALLLGMLLTFSVIVFSLCFSFHFFFSFTFFPLCVSWNPNWTTAGFQLSFRLKKKKENV